MAIKRINDIHGKTVINPKISLHALRRSINNLRQKKGCNDRDLTILLCQQVKGVNFSHYVDKFKWFLEVYMRFDPYFTIVNDKKKNVLNI